MCVSIRFVPAFSLRIARSCFSIPLRYVWLKFLHASFSGKNEPRRSSSTSAVYFFSYPRLLKIVLKLAMRRIGKQTLGEARQFEGKTGSLSGNGFSLYRSIIMLNDISANGEAHPRAFGFCAKGI